MFFSVSKVGWLLIQPIGILVLCFVAIFALTFVRPRWPARAFAAFGLASILVAAQTNAGRLLLQPLENRFARDVADPSPGQVAGIIVLGGGFDGHVTKSRGAFELGESGDRFVAAVLLAVKLPKLPIIVSGGEASLIGATEGDAAIAVRFFEAFGINPERLILESRSKNTHENALYTKAMLPDANGKPWLLVTSAFHMPRAVGAFRRQGVDVTPWPVDFRTTGQETFAFGRDDPIQALSELNLAMREWIGIAVYSRTGRIGLGS